MQAEQVCFIQVRAALTWRSFDELVHCLLAGLGLAHSKATAAGNACADCLTAVATVCVCRRCQLTGRHL